MYSQVSQVASIFSQAAFEGTVDPQEGDGNDGALIVLEPFHQWKWKQMSSSSFSSSQRQTQSQKLGGSSCTDWINQLIQILPKHDLKSMLASALFCIDYLENLLEYCRGWELCEKLASSSQASERAKLISCSFFSMSSRRKRVRYNTEGPRLPISLSVGIVPVSALRLLRLVNILLKKVKKAAIDNIGGFDDNCDQANATSSLKQARKRIIEFVERREEFKEMEGRAGEWTPDQLVRICCTYQVLSDPVARLTVIPRG